MKVYIKTTLRCPIEVVFNYITNHHNEPLWNPDVKAVRDYDVDEWGLGSTCTIVFQSVEQDNPKAVSAAQTAELLVTTYRPNEAYTFRSVTSDYVVQSQYLLWFRNETTHLELTSTIHLRGILMRTIMRVPIHRFVQRSLHRNFDNLKAILEHQPIAQNTLV